MNEFSSNKYIDVDSNSYKYPRKLQRPNHHTFASCSTTTQLFTLVFIQDISYDMDFRFQYGDEELSNERNNGKKMKCVYMESFLWCVAYMFALVQTFQMNLHSNSAFISMPTQLCESYRIIDVVRSHNNGKTFKWKKKNFFLIIFVIIFCCQFCMLLQEINVIIFVFDFPQLWLMNKIQ